MILYGVLRYSIQLYASLSNSMVSVTVGISCCAVSWCLLVSVAANRRQLTAPPPCRQSRAIQRMTAMRDDGVMAFIGPGEACVNEALVAAAWNLPLITYVSSDFSSHLGQRMDILSQMAPQTWALWRLLVGRACPATFSAFK